MRRLAVLLVMVSLGSGAYHAARCARVPEPARRPVALAAAATVGCKELRRVGRATQCAVDRDAFLSRSAQTQTRAYVALAKQAAEAQLPPPILIDAITRRPVLVGEAR